MLQVATIHVRSRDMMYLALVRQLEYLLGILCTYLIDPELKAGSNESFINHQRRADTKTTLLMLKESCCRISGEYYGTA